MNWLPAINIAAGAVLGSSYYTLKKTQPYLRDRSFDANYNSDYVSRFVVGTVGGIILASVLNRAGSTDSGNKLVQFGAGVVAILGGYSAEAVEQILQRLTEVLLALVRGDGSEEAKAKASTAQALQNADQLGLVAALEAASSDAERRKILDQIKTKLRAPPDP